MKMSRRARRMAQHHRRHRRAGALNMVSLMDIFTILVFFLLVNASEVELITPPRGVELPESSAEQRPEPAVTVTVTAGEILLDNRRIAVIDRQLAQSEGPLDSLVKALLSLPATGDMPGALTVVADRGIEYDVIKRILQSCTAAGFENLELAVLQAPEVLR